jgi:hypothetical protein
MEELYNQLYNDGKYTKTFEDFNVQFGSPEKSEKLYQALNQSGDYTKSFDEFKTQFSIPAKIQDSASADPTVESRKDTGFKSEDGSSEQIDASDFKNTQEKPTWIEQIPGIGKNEVTDFFGDIYRSASSGWAAGKTVDEAFDVFKGKEASDDEIMSFIEKSRELEGKGQADEVQALSKKMASLRKEGYNGVAAFFGAWWDNPSAMLQIATQSLAQMAAALTDSEEVRGTAAAGAGGGAALGAGVGSIVPVVGTGAGAIAGGIGGFMGGLSGSMEAGMTTAQLIQEEAVKDGLEWGSLSDKERFDYVRKIQNDTEKFNDIKSKAVARGMTIGAIDGVTGAILPGVGNVAFKSVAKGAKSALAQAARVGSTAALETAGGIASEVAGQAAAGQEFNLEEILIEGFADKTFTGVSIIKGAVQGGPKYSINGEKMNGKQFIDNIKILDDEAFVATDAIKVENSPAVEKLISDRRQNIAADQSVDSRINDVEDRAKAIKLINERNKLSGNKEGNKIKITQVQAELDAIAKKYENSDVDATIEQRKQAIAQAVDNKFESEFNKNYKALKEAEAETGIEPVVFEGDNAYLDAIEKTFGPEGREKAKNTDGVFAGEGKVFINKAQAKRSIDIATGNTGAISVASHEVLHPIFNALIGGAKTQGQFVNEFRNRMTSKQKAYVDQQLKDRGYGKDVTGIELMNVFSDGIIKNEITYDQTLFEKIGDAIIKLFKGQGFDKLSFDNGRDVYNFLKEYNTSIKSGKLSNKAISTIKEAETKKGVKVAEAKLLGQEQFSKTLSPEQTSEVTNDILAVKQLAEEEAAVAAKFGKEPIKGGKQARLEQKVISTLKPIIDKVVTNRTQALYDPIAPDAKKAVSRQEFQESMRSDLEVMILNEYNGSQDIEKFLINRGYLRANNLAKRLGIESQEDGGIKSDVTAAKDVASTEDVQTIDRSGAVERGQATFDQLDLVDDALISDIEKEISRELKTRSAKGTLSENVPLKLNNKIYETSWIEDFIDKTLFKKILKKWGAIGESNGKTKIPGAYIDFLNDQKNFDIIMKALPVKTIKKSYSKLFTLEKIGRELTAEGNPIFRVAPIDKKTFLQYFLDGKKTTILERQKQLAREIITPVAKETLANYATPENLSNLKEMQQLAPDTSLDLQAGIIINAQLEDLQSKLDRYKGEEKGFDVIQFSKNITPEGKKNIASALKDIVDKESNLSFNQTVAQDILNKLDGVKTFKDLAGLLWNAGDKTLGLAALREYRAELLKLLTNKLYYLDANIPKFIISAVSQGHNKVFGKQQKVIGYAYAMAKVATNFENAKDNGQKAIIIENFLKFVSRSIRTLKIDGITTNKAIYNDLLVPIMGDPTKYGFTLTEGKVGNRIQSYINKDGKRLYGLADITRIKSDFENSRSTINKEAIEVREWLMNEAKEAIKNKDIDAFIGFLSLLSADQRGVIRKMSSAGFSFANLILNDTVLEHETEALDIFNAWKSFAQGKLSKVKLIKFLKESKVNLVSKEFDGILKEARKEVSGAKNIGKARYKSIAPKTYIANLKKKGLILQPSKSQGTEAMQLSKTLNKDFNNIIENETKISAKSTISEAKSRMLGKNKGGWRFFVPPSADDFAGLMYRLLGKGDVGDKNAKWFKDNLFDPYGKGIRDFESYKQQTVQSFRNLKKSIKNVPKNLGKTNETGFTNDVAIRVYLWNKKGIEIPGLDKNDIKELIDIVNNNQDFKNFADQVENLLQGYPEPENNWLAGTITTDVINKINTSKREEFLQEWQANADEIFSKENINKLRAAFGEDYVEALEDMLYRMKTGRNRPYGSNKLTNQFMNWVNDSVGTIMFFNTRSALLQTLSIANFINWGDNNPINAAKAFANQKQFWSDFTMIFNSDFLKQRRSGLKTDINADDIASAAETSTNKAKAALSSILKMGFLPTQIADSFAIAMGGASFLRNRIDSYIKEGLSQQEAESRAFLDFQEIAEETQQSSRPDRISQQQASPLGRIILAFANTPMQYMRLTKKAILDIKNKRGDLKTNISKIVYYTAIQNIIFASLQSALFASLFDDEDEEAIDNKQTMVANSMLDTLLRGMGIGGAIVSTVKNIGLEIDKQSKKPRPDYTQAAIRSVDLSPPLSSKLRKLMSAGRAFSYKNVRDKMQGFSLENPAFYAGGQVVSAVTNVPLDRVIKKADNIRLAMDNDTKLWQKIALALGYSTWDVGIVQKEKAKGKSGFGKVPTWKKTEWKKVKW